MQEAADDHCGKVYRWVVDLSWSHSVGILNTKGWISPQPTHWESATTGKEQYSDQVSPPRRVRLCRNEDTIASSGRLFLVDGGPIELFYLSCLAANSNISN